MKSFAVLSLAAAALAMPQNSAPAGCNPNAAGPFTITTVLLQKRDLQARQAQTLTITLNNGILRDSQNRIGYIASNSQFQFDNPVQAGAQSSSGWSLCSNGSLALGGTTSFYQCLSGDFYNLYNAPVGAGCLNINLQAITGSSATVSQIPDGQPQATSAGRPISQIPDGQVQATSAGRPISQIPDGQVQATRPAPRVSQIPDGQPQATRPVAATSRPVVSQIPDGQPQATRPVVSQIPDGQPQATRPATALPTFTGGAVAAAGNIGAFAAGVAGLLAFL